jgi:hypothetical protein
MIKYSKNILLLSAIMITVLVTTITAISSQNYQKPVLDNQQNSKKNHYPIAIYKLPQSNNESSHSLRQIRNDQYDKPGMLPIKELKPGMEELPSTSHWWWGLSALPKTESDTVIIGKVINAEAHLSSNKTSIHSEFTLEIEEILKDISGISLMISNSIIAERIGGAVQFPSGRIQIYSTLNQGMPEIDKRYLFFLKYNQDGQDFSILTAYQLQDGLVTPLDGANSQLPFTDHKDRDETTFLEQIRQMQN